MTKKRAKALHDIAFGNRDEKKNGQHFTGDAYLITNGAIGLYSLEAFDGIERGEDMPGYFSKEKMIDDSLQFGDYFAITAPFSGCNFTVTGTIRAIKAAGRPHKSRPENTVVDVVATRPDGTEITMPFDPHQIARALDAIGPESVVYLGASRNSSLYTIIMVSKNNLWAIIMPIREQ